MGTFTDVADSPVAAPKRVTITPDVRADLLRAASDLARWIDRVPGPEVTEPAAPVAGVARWDWLVLASHASRLIELVVSDAASRPDAVPLLAIFERVSSRWANLLAGVAMVLITSDRDAWWNARHRRQTPRRSTKSSPPKRPGR
jgi:hypothetical protein